MGTSLCALCMCYTGNIFGIKNCLVPPKTQTVNSFYKESFHDTEKGEEYTWNHKYLEIRK